MDWGRRCVPLTRGLRIPWGILCGPLRVSGDSAGKVPRCSSGAEGTCAPGQAWVVCFPIYRVSGSARLDWGRRCVPLTRGLRIPWGILCGSLRVLGESAGKVHSGSSEAEGACAATFNFHDYSYLLLICLFQRLDFIKYLHSLLCISIL